LLTYSLTVERQLPYDIAATLSYTGTEGYNLVQVQEGNPAPPNGIPTAGNVCTTPLPAGQSPNLTSMFDNGTGTACWLTTVTAPRENTHFGTIQYFQPEGYSNYNSLQFAVVKRITRGLQFQSSYTWSHLIDNREGTAVADGGTDGTVTGTMPLKPSVDRGNGDYDQRQVYRFNLIYNFPKFSAENGVVSKFVNGWWMSTILSAQSGLPLNVVLGSNRSGSLNGAAAASIDRPDLVPGRTAYNITHGVSTSNGIDPCPTAGEPLGTQTLYFDPCAFTIPAAGFLGDVERNFLRGPGLTDLDFSLVKDTHFTSHESVMLEFRTEVFNILNRTNFAPPANSVYAATANVQAPTTNAGLITSTVGTSRQIQFALKLIF
jgi:hypothetical protein